MNIDKPCYLSSVAAGSQSAMQQYYLPTIYIKELFSYNIYYGEISRPGQSRQTASISCRDDYGEKIVSCINTR